MNIQWLGVDKIQADVAKHGESLDLYPNFPIPLVGQFSSEP